MVEGANQASLEPSQKKRHQVVVYTPDDWKGANPPFSDRLASLQKTFETEETATNVVQAAKWLVKANPFRIKTGLGRRIAMLAAVLLFIAIWVRVLKSGETQARRELAELESTNQPTVTKQAQVAESSTAQSADQSNEKSEGQSSNETNGGAQQNGEATADQASEAGVQTVKAQDIGERTPHLIAILMISAALGILFRASVRLFGNQVIRLDDVVNEFTVGALLAFMFLVLYLSGGILYQGDTLEVSPANFRRVATSVTVLGLASAVLLESAIVEARSRLAQTSRR